MAGRMLREWIRGISYNVNRLLLHHKQGPGRGRREKRLRKRERAEGDLVLLRWGLALPWPWRKVSPKGLSWARAKP